ncbi:MAG: hypothetical protein ACRD5H_09350 [Nitrososphaerales archaeon]
MSGESEIVFAMEQFERVHEKYLPKVDRMLVVDLFLRLRAEPNVKPMYTVEAFLKEGVDTQKLRNDIIRVTGVAPQFHDKGTHVVAHHKLDYDLLKLINDSDSVLEVKGTYMGSMASIGASHEPSTHSHGK